MHAKEIAAVSAVVREGRRFLLVMRGRAPSQGLLAFPGGRVEPGESPEDAVRRELLEETGIAAETLSLLREILIEGEKGQRYRLKVFLAPKVSGALAAGDDAVDAGWYDIEQMRQLPVTASTMAIVEELCSGRA